MRIVFISVIAVLITGCGKSDPVNNKDMEYSLHVKVKYTERSHTYKKVNPFDFFVQVYYNHREGIQNRYEGNFKRFCEAYSINPYDKKNQDLFYSILFYHQLFTSSGPVDGDRSGVLRILYFWHWVENNPRYQIRSIRTSKRLKLMKPPLQYAKYKSFADIDRLPALFYKDLFSPHLLYSHPDFGRFYTFGWCSEREMAFVCLLRGLGVQHTKVVVEGGHSWSELLLTFHNTKRRKVHYLCTVDNTYDQVSFKVVSHRLNIKKWVNDFGKDKMSKWYNQKARSPEQYKQIQRMRVPLKSSRHIERLVVNYLNESP
ncbi:MAG: hypothetical protein IEMM0008_1411 [bacterium]|nr:MAG: hypothetical protein IEMM0008_1411 [bacterium]